jgi:hypothetical protein
VICVNLPNLEAKDVVRYMRQAQVAAQKEADGAVGKSYHPTHVAEVVYIERLIKKFEDALKEAGV